jgi:hypothetical protein
MQKQPLEIKAFPLIRLDLAFTLFHGFDTLGSHLRGEGSLGYDGGLVRLRVQMKLDTYFNRQQFSYRKVL